MRALPRSYTSLGVFNSDIMRDWIKLDRNKLISSINAKYDSTVGSVIELNAKCKKNMLFKMNKITMRKTDGFSK